MPARGVRPPDLTLAAVRAIAPVAGMPPKQIEPMLATPWAQSSRLDLCRPPIMPSATTAQRRDSMAARRAIVVALGIRRLIVVKIDGWAAVRAAPPLAASPATNRSLAFPRSGSDGVG